MTLQTELGASVVLDGWPPAGPASGPHVVGVLPGEGIGPEVVAAALDVLAALEGVTGARFQVRTGPEAAPAPGEHGHLADVEADFFHGVFAEGGAVLCGPREGRFVYDLRERFDLFCKLTPVRPLPSLLGVGPCRAETARGADLLFVRENVGGLYFGAHQERRAGGALQMARHSFGYERAAVERIARVGAALAATRRGRLTVVVKSAGLPALSALWHDSVEGLDEELEVEFLEIDNACYQVVADARRFDVVLAPNMFGDVIADVAVLLLGSRGLSHSANFGDRGRAVYQTAHGAARDLLGLDCANPVGQILSLASMIEESFGLSELAGAVRRGAEAVLADGWRTADVMAPGCTQIGTRELGKRIAERSHALASGAGPGS